MRSIGAFFIELRRRRILRVTALYIIAAWVVLQVADLAFPGLRIPEAAILYVWIGAIAGFPVALIIGWRFDIVGGRIVRTAHGGIEENLAPGRSDYAILAVLAAVVAVISYELVVEIFKTQAPQTTRKIAAVIDAKSIAVLPFTNMSGDESNDPFTLGIHDDVLTHISKISDIKVISRTSVARLDSSLSIPDIGQLLGVATVLEGGLQRIGDRVRINAQLIDAASDRHLWSETFDRELTTQNIFSIQSEIAAAITDKLRLTLSPQDEANLNRTPTQNFQAYEAYLLGKQRMTTRRHSDLLEAKEQFTQAIDLDPQYALAYVGLADANLLLNSYGQLSLSETLARVEPVLSRALNLDDQSGAAHTSLGLLRMKQGDTTGAETAYKRAITLDPNYATPYHWYGELMMRIGKLENAIPLLQSARELDPLSPAINVTLGEALEGVGKFRDAMALYRKVTEIEPDYPAAYYLIAAQYRSVYGRLDEAVRWSHEELAIEPTRDMSILALTYLDLGDDKKAEYWIDRVYAPNSST